MPDITPDTLQKAKDRFANAWRVRTDWDSILHREYPVKLQPELESVQEGIDYETPDLEKATFDHIDVLMMNPSIYDLAPIESSQKARAEGREILMWTARGWEHENRGRWVDRLWAEGQVRYGYAVTRLMHRPQNEPDIKASTAEEINHEVEEAQRKRRHPFFWKDVSIYSCAWLGDERSEHGPDFFAEWYEVPYLEAREQFASDLKSLEQLGKQAWLGGSEVEGASNWQGESVTVVVVDARDPTGKRCSLPGCDHPQRIIRVYVGPDDTCIDSEHLISESPSPFPGCSYFVVAGRSTSSTDPNRRFRPLIQPLYVEANMVNYITTLELTEVRNDYSNNDIYVPLAGTDPAFLPEDRENNQLDFEHQPGKIPYLPNKIERVPKALSPHLQVLRQDHQKRLDSFKPNRFVVGDAYTEASNATGTAFIQQAQQAALPYNTLLSASDMAQLRSREYQYHAIKYWAKADPTPSHTRYYAVMTGNQDTVKIKGDQPRPGKVVYVDAERLKLDFDLMIRTKSETLAEEGARWLQAKDQFSMGAIDDESLFRAAGVDDIEGHKERLDRMKQAASVEPQFQQLLNQMHWRYFYGLTGIDPSQFLGPPAGQPNGQRPPQPQGDPRGGTNVISPNNMMGRSMQQAVVSGPDGGGSPVR